MHAQLDIRRRFNRRLLVFHGILAVCLTVLALHILHLQWIEHQKLALQADRNRINIVPLLPVRGEIVDRNGRALATNRIAYQVLMIPERVENIDMMLQQLAAVLHWSPAKIQRLRKHIRHSRPDRPVLLDDKLPWEVVAPIAARLHHYSGIDVRAGAYRYYPYGETMSHLIGYLSLADSEDVKAGYLPTEFVGRSGVERAFESTLHGRLGWQKEEVDAHGRRISVLERSPPVMGEKLRLTIDAAIQSAAAKALGARTGAVVVLDVATGAVLTLLSKPGYDSNRFITGLEEEQWQAWLKDKHKPLLNRAIQAAYPPASTFKLISALAGLRHGAPLATGTTVCEGAIELADRKLRCWNRAGHQRIDLTQALVQSCDVYFYELSDQLGMAALIDEAKRWGLGSKTGIVISPESRGTLPSRRANMMAGIGYKKWFRGETMITAIGQGALAVTPLQIARLAAAIANGGKLLKPKLRFDAPTVIQRQVDVSPEHLRIIRNAMYGVVNDPHGTAYWHMRKLPWKAAGKTGTAQVVALAQDDEKEQPTPEYDRHKDHAWFMGYAPFENPKIAFAVFVEHGGHGGSAAAPVAAALIRAVAEEGMGDPRIDPNDGETRR